MYMRRFVRLMTVKVDAVWTCPQYSWHGWILYFKYGLSI